MKKPKFSRKRALKRLKDLPTPSLPAAFTPGHTDQPVDPASVPRITNESVAEHREEVLGRARKFIYPLRHSRKRIVKLSIGIFVLAVIAFMTFCSLALYKFQSTSAFVYGVTRVIPFPIAHADGRFVSYESYLFEVRHYMHYYQTQQAVNFSTASGQQQLQLYKQRSLQQVIDRAYVDQLASKHHVHVTDAEVNQQVTLARSQNRLGASDAVFKLVLNEFWGWSVNDFKSELRQELLAQKVAATLDPQTTARATSAYSQLQAGTDFGQLAQAVSDDTITKPNGGAYGFDVTESNRDLPPQVIQAIFSLQPGQYSGVINTGYALEIVKLLGVTGNKRQAAHMVFQYQDISHYVDPLKVQHPAHSYIHIN